MSAMAGAALAAAQLAELKDQGNELFNAGRFAEAAVVYGDALRSAGAEADAGVRRTLLSNRAACRLKLGQMAEAAADCELALDGDQSNVKVLYRRAQAMVGLKKVEQAYKDLHLVLELDKSNAQAAALMKQLRSLASELNSTTAQTMAVVDACCGSGVSDAERTHKLRSVMGSILEDAQLARAICQAGACAKLWSLRERDSVSLKILSKMTEFDGCCASVLAACSAEGLAGEVRRGGDGAPAALNALWRLRKFEDAAAAAEAGFSSSVGAELAMALIVGAVGAEDEALRRVGVEAAVRLCTADQSRAQLFLDKGGVAALRSLLRRDLNRNEPLQQCSVVLGQVLPSLKDDAVIKAAALELCRASLGSADVFEQILGMAALDAVFYANKELGQALVAEEGLLETVKRVARGGAERAQALAAEVLSHVANTEQGRAMLAGEATDLLKLLATSSTGEVRSAAAVALAKLNAIDFNSESESGMMVLSSVVALLDAKASKEEHARGVEAVSFVITDSLVKNMFVKGQGLKVLGELTKLAQENAKEPYAYGLSYIFENLTMSEDDKKRDKLREMEVTEEQWEQFEKITKSATRKSGQKDSREAVDQRVRVFVDAGAVPALRALALTSQSERVWEAAARALCNIATVQSVRGQMIAGGALKAALKLSSQGSDKCKQFAAHALGKIFVTTDPKVLKDEQIMDTVGPLVRQVRHCNDSDLVVFECCMALTNIATVSFEAKQKIVNAKAIQALEYAQYNDNLMVRRAATEALNNLVPCEQIVEWITRPDKLRLWLLFAQAADEDQPTACAATGALANLAADERVAKALKEQEEPALPKIVGLAASDDVAIVHRAVVCLLQLAETWPEGKGKEALKEAGAPAALKRALHKFGDSSAAPAAAELLQLLAAV